MNTANLMARAALLSLQRKIEWMAVDAKMDLGLSFNFIQLETAEKNERNEAPRFVNEIQLVGKISQDMYDDAPGHTYFQSNSLERHQLGFPMTVTQAIEKAISLHQESVLANHSCDEGEFDGQFTTHQIVLLDKFDETLQFCKVTRTGVGCLYNWFEPDAKLNLPAMTSEAKQMRSEASFQRGWDNHSTGDDLETTAIDLLHKVSVMKLQQLAVY